MFLSSVSFAVASLAREEMLGLHVEDDPVAFSLLGLVVARLLGLLGYLLVLIATIAEPRAVHLAGPPADRQ